ncbi:MAG: HAMP domain-containing histidine kinase [Bacteroidales bacterium]|nr:HAMP domain-containing histidine kinase [Bacteroidales bacterium]MCF8403177.1 HAMP domain-containing histidine kinase [Bacteroidales bacterium]
MNFYERKKRWKLILFGSAVVIVAVSLWITHILIREIARDERNNIKIWADAIHQKAELVNYTEEFFKQLQNEERKRVVLLGDAYRIVTDVDDSEVLNFFVKFISENTTIPVILTDERGKIKNAINVNFDTDTVPVLKGALRAEFMVYPPVKIAYDKDQFDFLFYKESKLFNELREVLDDLIDSFFSEIVINSASVPVIITDSTKTRVIEFGMLDTIKASDSVYIMKTLEEMAYDNEPIEIDFAEQGKRYIFYQDSQLLTRLMIFPYLQWGIISVFLFISYVLFSTARKNEQNQVWVGLAKETAHQLGTPLSSMIGWIELLKMDGVEGDAITELNKDVERLHKITDRFSKIGAEPKLKNTNLVTVIYDSVDYIKSRTSRKVTYTIKNSENEEIFAPINLHLFEWVIENICKNAVDAIEAKGCIDLEIIEENNLVMIDISDDGKGIPKSRFKTIFNPGYTSKKRGWGLGLSLSKRIISDYHNGKIFVKSSVMNKGTTFRIMLRKENTT